MKKKTIDHTELLLLTLLEGEDMYGYQIISELEKRSEHVFEMKEGTLYPVLHSLWKSGAVECYEAEAPSGRKRKYYHITRKGRDILRLEREKWKTYARGVEAVLSYAPAVG
ncbi:MAG: helix-turn-helix transcriptional regulator [Oscillospiraceae bacterium]|nr:helix-turn-helix transcriptional regulator [Oscillospiraceae bacterium]